MYVFSIHGINCMFCYAGVHRYGIENTCEYSWWSFERPEFHSHGDTLWLVVAYLVPASLIVGTSFIHALIRFALSLPCVHICACPLPCAPYSCPPRCCAHPLLTCACPPFTRAHPFPLVCAFFSPVLTLLWAFCAPSLLFMPSPCPYMPLYLLPFYRKARVEIHLPSVLGGVTVCFF
jgi:hypothetical protein